MTKYFGQTMYFPIGTTFDYREYKDKELKFCMRSWGNYIIEAMPRYGKSVVAKDLAVQISKHRQVIIFDYGGEWQNAVTQYNMDSPYPDRMVKVNLLHDFTFKINDFLNKEDFASLGFEGTQANMLSDILKDTIKYHEGDVITISELLAAIPIKKFEYQYFNSKYGTNLTGNINNSTKTSITSHWDMIKKYFWQGEDDRRTIIDFGEELKKGKHMIINLRFEDKSLRKFVARAYIGKILEQMQRLFRYTKPFIFVEEARTFFPSFNGKVQYSSNVQVHDLVTYGPKEGVSIMFIAQHEKQLFEPLFQNIHAKIVGVVREPGNGPEFQEVLVYEPTQNVREFLYVDVNSTPNRFRYSKFRPRVPCMEFRSDR